MKRKLSTDKTHRSIKGIYFDQLHLLLVKFYIFSCFKILLPSFYQNLNQNYHLKILKIFFSSFQRIFPSFWNFSLIAFYHFFFSFYALQNYHCHLNYLFYVSLSFSFYAYGYYHYLSYDSFFVLTLSFFVHFQLLLFLFSPRVF